MFLKGDMISKEASGSKIDLEEIRESTDVEPIVDTRTQQETETSVEETDITPPPLRRTSRVSMPPRFYGFHITEKEEDTYLSDRTLIDMDEPSNYKKAMAGHEAAKWKDTMENEI